ncbi:MAG: RsmB/NOP family class I SAM-dependent RNA methyltransferase [Lachnospiraceae bacterium]|jgi:NOL1/NOP2/sun family putative RNA methylase
MKLPSAYERQMTELLGEEEYRRYLACFSEPRQGGLRVNTAKITPADFEKICPYPLTAIPWIPGGYYLEPDVRASRDPYYFAGLYYLQEPSAMTPASFLPVREGDRVADLCAAPGGKSTALAAKLRGTGFLLSNDISSSRTKALLKNLELFGVSNALITSETPDRLAERFPEYFDRVLVDAPCSGEGMFRKEPAVIRSWEEHGHEFYVNLQRQITAAALKMLRPGGILAYSTCTFSPLENERIIAELLAANPGLKVRPLPDYPGFDRGHPDWADGNPQLAGCVRIWPQRVRGEGHFIAQLQKPGGNPARSAETEYGTGRIPSPGEKHNDSGTFSFRTAEGARTQRGGKRKDAPGGWRQSVEEFSAHVKRKIPTEQAVLRDESVMIPALPDQRAAGLRIMRNGLLLGESRKGRFEPSQALAMTLSAAEFDNVLDLPREDDRVIRYLKGETIEGPEVKDGYVLVCVTGYPLGFGKAARGMIKNRYLPGWRWQ